MGICYWLNPSRFHEHLLEVQVKFTANSTAPLLWLPTWVPGSYLIREFSRHIEQVQLVRCAGQEVQKNAIKISKNRWQITGVKVGDELVVRYLVYAYDLSVRGSYIDAERIYINTPSVCLTLSDSEHLDHEVVLEVPKEMADYQFACALSSGREGSSVTFKASNYEELIDSPFELAAQQCFSFEVAGVPHQYVISGRHRANLERMKTDLKQLCGTYLRWLPQTNFTHYVFLTIATASDYGGLEHQHSTSLITPRDDLPKQAEPKLPSENYQRYLGLCSHEYFHAWWVKWVRPVAFRNPDLNTEAYTRLLWVFEGFTSYIDDLMLYRSGLIDTKSYLKLLETQINRYLQTPGRLNQSTTESSFDAWIKLYRSDENSANAGASYYNVGALCALCVDLMLRQTNYSITELISQIVSESAQGRDLTEDRLDELLADRLGDAWASFKRQYIDGTHELPLEELLTQTGLEVTAQNEKLALGMRVSEEPSGLQVSRVLRGSSAAKAGVSAKDTLVAIDGHKASKALLEKCHSSATTELYLFRRGELKCVTSATQASEFKKLHLKVKSADQVEQWLSCEWSQQ